jgi:hypothetical protein
MRHRRGDHAYAAGQFGDLIHDDGLSPALRDYIKPNSFRLT